MLIRMIDDNGVVKDEQVERIIGLIDRYCTKLRENFQDGVEYNEHIYRIEAWAGGFKDSLNELVQSRYMARWFGQKVSKPFEEEMDQDELADYQCHVYFYKNTFVRIFSVLDKLGYFMNELFMLRTEKVKPRYSFFTVLRQMSQASYAADLYSKLQRIKAEYKDPLNILRKKRNTEIHYINVEMLDDMQQTRKHFTSNSHIEDLDHNMMILEQGCQMVLQTMETVFEVCSDRLPTSRAR